MCNLFFYRNLISLIDNCPTTGEKKFIQKVLLQNHHPIRLPGVLTESGELSVS